jgi:hypothetical protein
VWGPLLEALCAAGQLALLRRQLAGEAARAAGADAAHLATGAAAAGAGLAAEARHAAAAARAARRRVAAAAAMAACMPAAEPLAAPLPTPPLGPLARAPGLAADLAALQAATGQHDPLMACYNAPPLGHHGHNTDEGVFGAPPLELDELPALLFFFTLAQLPRYVVDKRLGVLRPGRRHVGSAPDAAPLAAGAALLLRQAAPAASEAYLALLGQYCRVQAQVAAAALAGDPSAAAAQPSELVAALGWCAALARVGGVPHAALRAHVPPWLLDTVVAAAPAPRR